jgi:predicted phage tail component-like protein
MPVSVRVIKNNVTYDLADYGLALLKHNIPLTPPKEDYTIDIPGRPGKIKQGSKDKERPFNLEFILMAEDSTYDYQAKVADFADLLYSPEPLYWIFGDIPGKRFQGEYNGAPDIEKMIFDGRVTVPIICFNPYVDSITDVTNGWGYGQGYTYNMGLRYGDVYSHLVTLSPTVFEVYHAGNVPIKPRILITGSFTNLHLNDGRGNELIITRVNGPSDVIEIDCEESTIYLNTNQNIYSSGNGVFFELPKGITTFTVTATGTINCIVAFTPFRHKYVY